jgi:hypothetical protein
MLIVVPSYSLLYALLIDYTLALVTVLQLLAVATSDLALVAYTMYTVYMIILTCEKKVVSVAGLSPHRNPAC